ncbi:hypothetical protein [Pseudomonas capsici]|uniref:hypothetical protein n=1 Tax=Pseudomonas capsici TaxID=2810614 RepID=UPI0021F23AF8|nr:hypothetical protein [Pseudomonas capsici]MCV4265051.1 hypothetical protein [Pseudomonas capsici]
MTNDAIKRKIQLFLSLKNLLQPHTFLPLAACRLPLAACRLPLAACPCHKPDIRLIQKIDVIMMSIYNRAEFDINMILQGCASCIYPLKDGSASPSRCHFSGFPGRFRSRLQ